MASRKEYEMLFRLNAQLGGNYSSTFKSAQDSIASMQKEMTSLSKAQSDISAYEKQQNAVEASRKKLESLQQQYDNIQREISETGEFSSVLENKLLSKQQQIDRTAASLSSQTAKLDQMGNSLREAGVDTENLTGESAKLGQQIDEIKVKQEEAADGADNFGTKASAAFSAVEQAIIAAGIAVALKEIADMYSDAIEASMEFESAMTGVAKTTDMSAEELAAMSSEIKDLSTEIPIVTEELAGIGETAGQLGIAKNDILDFSEVMAMLATATTMTAEEGATMLAQFANITRMDPKYYSNLASTIVDLGNNFATTEQKITNMSQGIAASASLAGMSEADMVALSTAVTSLGIETQAGATSMSKLISELMTAVETGEKLDEFATIANMSAQEFSQVWGNNAVDALQAFVLGLSDTERNGKSATVALTELGITETRMQRMVLSLANSGDLLNRTLDTSSKAWSENTALVKEAELRYGTSHSQLTMMENAYNNLKIAVGDN
ncbi:MAG TPA: phage tail tape measure protein, partial [Clostridiales bacterium]|nr:phage tail tape measure protein [Clostridiales bacterium]